MTARRVVATVLAGFALGFERGVIRRCVVTFLASLGLGLLLGVAGVLAHARGAA